MADPAAVRTGDGWVVLASSGRTDAGAFPVLTSSDLTNWRSTGFALEALPTELGDSYWAPEVCCRNGSWWMYYSVGHADRGHLLRVARADRPEGPYRDEGIILTPDESFAIDASPFRAEDGRWWLFFARDVLDDERPGTHLAVAELISPTRIGEVHPVLSPYADWQIFARDREMYGSVIPAWHTLEGPHVITVDGRIVLTFSGGNWSDASYCTAWAWAEDPCGPWHVESDGRDILMRSDDEWIGPGHNSITTGQDGAPLIVFHAWDDARTGRYMHIRPLAIHSDPLRVRVELG